MKECKFCKSEELVYNSKVADEYCQSCSQWQHGETLKEGVK